MGQTEDGLFEFIGLPNAEGFLGKLVSIPFYARDRGHAEEIAYRVISSSLSGMSLRLDIPLDIAHREIKEMANESAQISFVSPDLAAPMAIHATAALQLEFRSFASLYREALNTNSPVYELLCLFKIVEALYARRARLAKSAKRQQIPYNSPIEVLPTTNLEIGIWLEGAFQYTSRI
jgi:hypothetical protein